VRRRLPDGAARVAAGLLVAGVTIYAFLSLSARALGADDYAALAALWALIFLAGPGLFTPLEQETARSVSARVALGQGSRPGVARAATLGLGGGAVLGLLVVLAMAPIADLLFDGARALVLAFAASLPGYGALYVLRGTLLGQGRFGAAGSVIAGEGVLRLLGGVAIAVVGGSVTGYALVIGLAPGVTVLLALAVLRIRVEDGPPVGWRALSGAVGALFGASFFGTALLNVGPLISKAAAGADDRSTAILFAGLLLVRPPLYLWYGFTSALLPALTTAATRGDHRGVITALRRIGGAVGAIALVTALGALAVGVPAARLLFGSDFEPDRYDLAILALATCGFMLGNAIGAGLVAIGRARRFAVGWGAGLAAMLAVSLVDPGSARLIEVALVASVSMACVVMALPLIRLTADGAGAQVVTAAK
jgi:O-antigen/teichoic acid export membrane protein